MKLLLVEDDVSLASALLAITKRHYCIDWTPTLKDAYDAYAINTYEAIIADLGLPDGNGMELCKLVRDKGDAIPFLVLTANPDPLITSLLNGADDYLVKPFHSHELLARIHALLRRSTHYLPDIFHVGNLEIDRVHKIVTIAGNPLTLRRKEYDILTILASHFDNPVHATVMIESVWSSAQELFSNSVEVHIFRLRHTLKLSGSTVTIKTVKNYGYKLTLA